MPQSSRHKSHKHSKHSSKEAKDKDSSDSEEDVKMKEKSSKGDSMRAYRDSASGEKHKISSQVRKGKDCKDLSGDGNGEASEEYVSSKRRKEKAHLKKERADVSGRVSGDRWDGAGEERGRSDRNVEKEINKGGSSKIDMKLKESNNKGESLRVDSKSKSKRHESGTGGENKEENVKSLVVEKDESKRQSKRKSERISLELREGKELKVKESGLDKDKKDGQESKHGDAEVKALDGNLENNHNSQLVDLSGDRQRKRGRENTAWHVQDGLRNPKLEKELEKGVRRTREGFTDRENDDKRLSTRNDCSKDVKNREERHHMGGSNGDRHADDGDRDDRHGSNKQWEDADKDMKHRDTKHQENSDKEARHIDGSHRENSNRDSRCRGEKYREDGEREKRRRDDKYWEAPERDGRRRNDKYSEDAERESSYREGSDRDNRCKEEPHLDDTEKYSRHKDRNLVDDFDREKKPTESKYRDEHVSRDLVGNKSNTEHSRDDGYAGDRHSGKSIMYDDGVSLDDRIIRNRDDQGTRRSDAVEDFGNIGPRCTQDQRSDAEKKSASSARMDGLTRGRSTSRNADVEISSSHSRRRSSPRSSSHASREHHRLSNEIKYSDYAYEEKIQYKTTSTRDYTSSPGGAEKISSSRSLEKLGQKGSHLGDLSAERHLKSDILTSPLQLISKSPSSSTDRRHSSKSNVRKSLDIEDSAQDNSGSKDVKDYFGKEGRGNRELAMGAFPGDEISQPDGDTLSVSSPFSRNSRLSHGSKPLLPPPFRTGMDSHCRRIGDPDFGRVQGNAWGGVPNWPSPVANGFIPFPHGPPPVGFHSMMQQFPVPSIFGVRPSVDLNHSQGPYRMPDADSFSGNVPSMGWHNPVDDSRPLPLHGWNSSNAVFSNESQTYERPEWNPSRTFPGGQGWETSGDLWKGPNRTASMDRPSSSEKQNNFVQGDEISAGQNEQTQRDQQADSADISQLSDSLEKNSGAEAPHISQEDTSDYAKMSRKDDGQFCHVYLSKLDISADLTEPESFKQWASIINTDQNMISDSEDSKILYTEQAETQVASSGKTLSISLFAVKNDSVFQKAMSHYKRQTEVSRVINEEKLSLLSMKVESIPKSNQEELNEENDKVEELSSAGDMQDTEDDPPNSNEVVEHPNCSPMMEGSSRNLHQELSVPVIMNIMEESEELIPASDQVNRDVDMDSNLEMQEHIAENHLSMDDEGSGTHLLAGIEEVPMESAGNVQELESFSTKCGTLLNSDMPSEACEGIMPESEYGIVNLSRIHNSPESTH
ncbi:ankyrin repeat domain-containing protein 11-like isoform X1 [Olea europaea var. sylvestris]|uniref:ankyrin repeat domain-containing protein 11-like isoform X1 n=1 Tax=Olea europaea var. sylvestris TaxID=158386 RepID=UPI000C1D7B7E|nr:ankyrin repeat domain-containing protein 11-like isoform X1 [Olea europaea var. sylvestris]